MHKYLNMADYFIIVYYSNSTNHNTVSFKLEKFQSFCRLTDNHENFHFIVISVKILDHVAKI